MSPDHPHLPDISRRTLMVGGVAFALTRPATGRSAALALREIARGLITPESPKPQRDGSVLLVEMVRGTLTRVRAGGETEVVAHFDAMPNGCAFGPGGKVYVTLNAASVFKRDGDRYVWSGVKDPGGRSRIAWVDPVSGRSDTLFATSDHLRLVAPNDLVFDRRGGFYFSDTGAAVAAGPTGAVYYATADGHHIARLCDVPLANGIVLTPDQRRLRICSGKTIVEYRIESPGRLVQDATGVAQRSVFARLDHGMFDSMAGLADGGIMAGALYPGGLARFAPDGTLARTVPIAGENAVTNVGFGGRDLRSAYASLTETGRLVMLRSDTPGMRLAYSE